MPKTKRLSSRPRVGSFVTEGDVSKLVTNEALEQKISGESVSHIKTPGLDVIHGINQYYQPRTEYKITERTNDYNGCEKQGEAITLIATTDRFGDLYMAKSPYGLLHIQPIRSRTELAAWSLRVNQYNELGPLKIREAWICNDGAHGMRGFLLVQIPVGLAYIPLREFVMSAQTSRDNLITGIINRALPTESRVKNNLRASGIATFFHDTVVRQKLVPNEFSPEMLGILYNSNTGEIRTIVMAPLPPMFKTLPPNSTDAEKIAISLSISTFHELISGVNRSRKDGKVLFKSERMLTKALIWLVLAAGVYAASSAAASYYYKPGSQVALYKGPYVGSSANPNYNPSTQVALYEAPYSRLPVSTSRPVNPKLIPREVPYTPPGSWVTRYEAPYSRLPVSTSQVEPGLIPREVPYKPPTQVALHKWSNAGSSSNPNVLIGPRQELRYNPPAPPPSATQVALYQKTPFQPSPQVPPGSYAVIRNSPSGFPPVPYEPHPNPNQTPAYNSSTFPPSWELPKS